MSQKNLLLNQASVVSGKPTYSQLIPSVPLIAYAVIKSKHQIYDYIKIGFILIRTFSWVLAIVVGEQACVGMGLKLDFAVVIADGTNWRIKSGTI